MNRRRFVAAVGAGVLGTLALDAWAVEPRRLDVTRHRLDGDADPYGRFLTFAQVMLPVRFGAAPELAVFTMGV